LARQASSVCFDIVTSDALVELAESVKQIINGALGQRGQSLDRRGNLAQPAVALGKHEAQLRPG
jgi:hypothetical protein